MVGGLLLKDKLPQKVIVAVLECGGDLVPLVIVQSHRSRRVGEGVHILGAGGIVVGVRVVEDKGGDVKVHGGVGEVHGDSSGGGPVAEGLLAKLGQVDPDRDVLKELFKHFLAEIQDLSFACSWELGDPVCRDIAVPLVLRVSWIVPLVPCLVGVKQHTICKRSVTFTPRGSA